MRRRGNQLAVCVAIWQEWGGRSVRDWGLVLVCFLGYAAGANALPDIGVDVHFTPQIDAERLLFFGHLPTIWLQEHLHHGTGPLEVFSILMYLSHFVVPGLLASLIWLYWPGRGFGDLLFGLTVAERPGQHQTIGKVLPRDGIIALPQCHLAQVTGCKSEPPLIAQLLP